MKIYCEDCKFWHNDIDIPSMGLCRRYAPRPDDGHPVEGPESIDCLWPRKKNHDFCGEWSAKDDGVEEGREK